MLAFPVEGVARWLLYGLLALWAALLGFGLLLGKPDAARRNRLPRPVRLLLSTTLVVAAFVWWRVGTAPTALDRYGLLMCLGMVFGLLGDLFMAGLLVAKPRNVIFGILAFGAGHGLYIAGLLSVGDVLGLDAAAVRLATLAVYWAAAVPLWMAMVRNPAKGPVLGSGTLVYSLLLTATGASATALAVQEPAFWPLAVGGLAFIASDLILGSELMRATHFPFIGDVIWVAYTVGQMLIVYSSSTALQLL